MWAECSSEILPSILFEGGILESACSRLGGRAVDRILCRELLPQFLNNSSEISHKCLPWGVDEQTHYRPLSKFTNFFFPLGAPWEGWASSLLGSGWGFFILFLPHHMRWGFEVCKTLITLFKLQYLLPINKLVHVVDLMLWLCFMR